MRSGALQQRKRPAQKAFPETKNGFEENKCECLVVHYGVKHCDYGREVLQTTGRNTTETQTSSPVVGRQKGSYPCTRQFSPTYFKGNAAEIERDRLQNSASFIALACPLANRPQLFKTSR